MGHFINEGGAHGDSVGFHMQDAGPEVKRKAPETAEPAYRTRLPASSLPPPQVKSQCHGHLHSTLVEAVLQEAELQDFGVFPGGENETPREDQLGQSQEDGVRLSCFLQGAAGWKGKRGRGCYSSEDI